MSEIFAEPQIVHNVRHVDVVRLVLGGVCRDVKVTRRFVDEKGRFKITAFLIVYLSFNGVVQKADLMPAALILNVQTDVFAGQSG